MIPAGYLLKRNLPPPGWLKPNTSHISEVCSVSSCVNDDVVDLFAKWEFNKFGLASSEGHLFDRARQATVDLSDTKLFFYSIYEYELESDGWTFDPDCWQPLSPSESSSIEDKVVVPDQSDGLRLLGYDVVTYGDCPEHSPLSCNSIATTLDINQYCLFDTFDTAKEAINTGKFGGGCEEGLYRIMSVSRIDNGRI